MAEIKYCECCGAKMQEYRHVLNKPMVLSLIALFRSKKLKPGLISKILDHNQLCNFQKLRYWGLVEKHISRDGSRKGGVWKITNKGFLFLKGELKIPLRVWSFRGEFIRAENDKLVSVKDIHGSYEYRLDYVQHSLPRI